MIYVLIILISLYVVILRVTTHTRRYNASGRVPTRKALFLIYCRSIFDGLLFLIVSSLVCFYIASKV